MARPPSVDEHEVISVIEALQGQGKPINPYQVQKLLGGGSGPYIQKIIDKLDLEQAYDGEDPLTKQLVGLIRPLAAGLQDEKRQAIELAEARHQEQIREWEKKLDAKSAELSVSLESAKTLSESLSSTEQYLLDEKKVIETLSVEILELKSQVSSLQEITEERKKHISSLEEKHQHARDSLEHFRTSAKDQRDKDLRQHEQQVQQLQAELRRSAQTLSIKQNDITQLNQDNGRLIAEVGETRKQLLSLESQKASLEQTLSNRAGELQASAKDLELSQAKIKEQAQEISSLAERLTEDAQGREQLMLDIKALQTELEVKDKIYGQGRSS